MPKVADERFPLPHHTLNQGGVVDLLSGVVRERALSGEEALAALERITKLAHEGNLDARCELAYHLLANPLNSQINRKLWALLKPAAAAGHREALYLTGLLTLRGQGCQQDLPQGAALLERAAQLGQAEAQRLLAQLYQQGWGVSANKETALFWWRLAAGHDDAESARQAGLLCLALSRKEEALYWLKKGAELGDSRAQYELSRQLFALEREGNLLESLAHSSSNAQRAPQSVDSQRQRDAAYWLKEAALTGTVDAQFRLGLKFWSGQGGRVNLREALRWTARAAEGGSAAALATLSGFFLTGNILPISRFNAYVLSLAAERMGLSTATLTRQSLEMLLTYREKRKAVSLLKKHPDPKALVEAVLPRANR